MMRGIENARGGSQRIDGRIDAQLGDGAREVGGGVQVGEGGRRGRVGVVVGGHVDGLHRGDGALLGRGDALLQLAHFGGQVGLVAHGRRHAAQQRRHFRAGLREAENVVDEQQHVLAFFVAEVLRHGQAREAHAQTGAGRLGHLAVNQRHFRFPPVLGIDDAGFLHLEPQVVALAGALAHAGEHRHAAVLHGDVVDQLHDDDGLADAGAAEQADLAAAQIGLEQVDDLDAGLEHLQLGGLLLEQRRRAVDGIVLLRVHRAHLGPPARRCTLSTRPSVSLPTGTVIGRAQADGLHAAHQPVGGLQRDGAHAAFADVLLHFADDVDGLRERRSPRW